MKLTDKQKAAMLRGFNRGYSDPRIAKELELASIKVFRFRNSDEVNLSSAWIIERRYYWWERLLREGITLEEIADLYEVKAHSIYCALYQRGVRFLDVRKEVQAKRRNINLKRKLINLEKGAPKAPQGW